MACISDCTFIVRFNTGQQTAANFLEFMLHLRLTRIIAIVFIAAALGSCAAMRDPYPEASGPDAATLVIFRSGEQSMQVYGFRDSTYCTTPVNFGGTQLMNKGETRTVKVTPGQGTAISFHVASGYAQCDLIVSFVPQAQKTYRATLDSSQKQCSIRLVRVEGLLEVTEPTFRERIFTRPFSESGKFCLG